MKTVQVKFLGLYLSMCLSLVFFATAATASANAIWQEHSSPKLNYEPEVVDCDGLMLSNSLDSLFAFLEGTQTKAFFIANDDKEIVYVNSILLKITGLAKNDLLGSRSFLQYPLTEIPSEFKGVSRASKRLHLSYTLKTLVFRGEAYSLYILDDRSEWRNLEEIQQKTQKKMEKANHLVVTLSHELRTSLTELTGEVENLSHSIMARVYQKEIKSLKDLAEQLKKALNKGFALSELPHREIKADLVPAEKLTKKKEDLHILLVEDSAVIQKTTKKSLSRLGFTKVSVAANGLDAVLFLTLHNHKDNDDANQPAVDFVFMDINMPVMDGIEACSIIRKDSDLIQPRIVYLTGHATEEWRLKALETDSDAFYTKPLSPQELEAAINKYFIFEASSSNLSIKRLKNVQILPKLDETGAEKTDPIPSPLVTPQSTKVFPTNL